MLNKNQIIILIAGILIILIGFIILIYKTYFQISLPLDYQECQITANVTTNNLHPQTKQKEKTIIVQLSGAIKNPGIYKINANLRVYEAIDLSGGFQKNADIEKVNLVKICKDGQKIHVPFLKTKNQNSNIKISLNSGTEADLLSIPGIGQQTANKIIQYRLKNKGFNSVEELSNIKGISKNKFKKIKEYFSL